MNPPSPGIVTPNQWLDEKLRGLGISNAGLARLIGRSRTEVQRWVNGREQIPRHHLAEIAAQLGTARDLAYAIKLKECEDFADALRRRLRDLAHIGGCDPLVLEARTFDLLAGKTAAEKKQSDDEHASVLLYNMTHASFILRLWTQAAEARDFGQLLSPDHMKMHIQYPANHFLALALSLGSVTETMFLLREGALAYLRERATDRAADGGHELVRHHAIHMLARCGDPSDQALVEDLVASAATSTDVLSVRLGYAGLILRTGSHEVVEKYIWLLEHRDDMAHVDVMFEALHYGDVSLGPDRRMPGSATSFRRSVASVLRRLESPESPVAARELDIFRLLRLMDRVNPGYFAAHSAALSRLEIALGAGGIEGRSPYLVDARKRLAGLSGG